MTRRIVTPAKGLVVLHPSGRPLPKEGAWVNWDEDASYWGRHLRDGAITFSETEPEPPKPPRKSRKPITETNE